MNSWQNISTSTLSVVLLAMLPNLPFSVWASDRPDTEGLSSLPPAAQSRIYAIIEHDITGDAVREQGGPPPQKNGGTPARPAAASESGSQSATLVASDGGKSNELGYSLAMSGNTVVVGAPYATVGSKYAQGAAYVFVKPASGWANMTEIAKLTASEVAENAFFGSSVAISGDTVAVGADGVNVGANQYQGAAYVFVKPKGGWANMTETAKLTASDAATYAYFGSSIAIGDKTIFVGADGATVGANKYQGAAYVFEEPAGGWKTTSSFNAKLTASDGTHNSQMGYSMSISGFTLAVGARSAPVGSNSRQGAVYVFVKPSGGWATGTEAAKLTASDGASNDQLGYSVSIDGDTVAAGAPGSNSHGAAYLFVKPADGWTKMTQTAKLTGSDGAKGDQLGYSVSVSGDGVVAGASSAAIGANDHQGAVYVFAKPTKGWADVTPTTKLTVRNGRSRDGLGSSVSVGGDVVVAGAVNATVGQNTFQGAVHVFETPGRPAAEMK
ncbi:MAG: FG-GAP repeat protein [Terriglobales bacterium]